MTDFAAGIATLAQALGAVLRSRRLTLATAESCTAGGVSFAVTQVAGSSAWFDRGFVTYSNDAKLRSLGVSTATLLDQGAVSEAVAREMAAGAIEASAAQVAVAVTGIAGPDGGTPAKPVGTVCFGWALRRNRAAPVLAETITRRFEGDRAAVRAQSIEAALAGLIDFINRHREA
jgi:nicotinamide-nucleotide amidase